MAMITEYLEILLKGNDLTFEQAQALQDTIFAGEVSEPQVAAFLTAMRAKGATANEIAGLAQSLRSHALKVEPGLENLVDIVGTGGAAVKTFNVSTASALVAAGAGVHVAKHGNRAITSRCGSADVLAALGVKIDAAPEVIAECVREAHVGFMFAPMFHPAMKYVQPIRKALGFRTVFNILGPLANPAHVPSLVLGVADKGLLETMAQALKMLGTRYAMVVHSNGLDEISTAGITKIIELKDGQMQPKELNPADVGIAPGVLDGLVVQDAETSAAIVRSIIEGKQRGTARDIVVLNASAGIIAGRLANDFSEAIPLAQSSIDDGKAMNCLERLIEISNKG
jgi:anthranilate phosphoribosyltransferase